MTTQTTIKKPRITEKVAMLAEQGVYTFEVAALATKSEIRKEIEKIYKVKPLKINMLPIRHKKIMVRGRMGVKKGGKKAVVYLKKGDKIDIV